MSQSTNTPMPTPETQKKIVDAYLTASEVRLMVERPPSGRDSNDLSKPWRETEVRIGAVDNPVQLMRIMVRAALIWPPG